MKATILLGTLKTSGVSNTETLCEFLATRMATRQIQCEVIKLAMHRIPPGTYSRMGDDDEWPAILEQVLASDFLILATPIWWDTHSSLIQRVVELHDEVLAGRPSRLDGKVGAIVITGDSDGAQHIIGTLANFLNAVGVLVPPYGTLSVLWERQAKHAAPTRDELLDKYEAEYASTADKLVQQLLQYGPKAA